MQNSLMKILIMHLNLFDKKESERLHELRESAVAQSVSSSIDIPQVVEEQASVQDETVVQMNPYLQELSKY